MSVDGAAGAGGTLLRLRGLRRTFGEAVAVERLDLDVAAGEFFSLIGPSGCGKTTTLRMLAGLQAPSEGSIELAGQDITALPAHRRPVNTVFQQYALFAHLDVADNVGFGLREQGVSKRDARPRIERIVSTVGLTERLDARPTELSGGQQQRVALARALVLEPRLLLLDEPLGALDLGLRRQLQIELKRVQRELGIGFVYVTHDQEEAFAMSDRVGVMRDGRLDQIGTPAEVYERPASSFVARFVGDSNLVEGVIDSGSGGHYRVDLGPAGTHECGGVEGLERGESVRAVVRPEDVRVAPRSGVGARDGLASIPGRIADVAFLGPRTSLTVSADAGPELIASRSDRGAEAAFETGEPVTASFPPARAWLVRP